MSFPVWIRVGPVVLSPHPVFETLACMVGFRIYTILRRRAGDVVPDEQRLAVLAAAIVGAAIGSKLLAWANDPAAARTAFAAGTLLAAGKTVVGGLLGGLVAVEAVKRRMGVRTATGDLYVYPLIAGIAIGRIGCFLTGLTDDTYGNATSLPWGVDFGDGVARHPTQLYEIAFLALLALGFRAVRDRPMEPGGRFKLFMASYLAWRFAIDLIKPAPFSILGISVIQSACLLALVYYARFLPRLLATRRTPAAA
jgi:prolipoprotein diacylglyceryltransferase